MRAAADTFAAAQARHLSLEPCALRHRTAPQSGSASPICGDTDADSVSSDDTLVENCWSLGDLPWSPTSPGKQKYLPPCDHLGVSDDARIALWNDDTGRRYVGGPMMRKGTWGKLKLMLPIDNVYEVLCIKVGTLPTKEDFAAGPELVAPKKISVSHYNYAKREAKFSARFGGPFAAQRLYQLGKRSCMIAPLADDDLLHFAQKLQPPDLAVLGRCVALRVGETLKDMAEHHCVHGDVTGSNIFVRKAAPYAWLEDFGATVQLKGDFGPGRLGHKTTFCPPEVVDGSDCVTPRSDVWGLGAVLLTLLHPQPSPVPWFLTYVPDATGATDLAATAHKLGTFFDAGQGVIDARTRPILQWIEQCRRTDDALTELVVKTALVPLQDRWDAETFVEALFGLEPLPLQSDPREVLHGIMGTLKNVYTDTDSYRALHAVRCLAHREAALAPSPTATCVDGPAGGSSPSPKG